MALISQCEAHTFLTDYDDVKTNPEIIELKVRRRIVNKVTAERPILEHGDYKLMRWVYW